MIVSIANLPLNKPELTFVNFRALVLGNKLFMIRFEINILNMSMPRKIM